MNPCSSLDWSRRSSRRPVLWAPSGLRDLDVVGEFVAHLVHLLLDPVDGTVVVQDGDHAGAKAIEMTIASALSTRPTTATPLPVIPTWRQPTGRSLRGSTL